MILLWDPVYGSGLGCICNIHNTNLYTNILTLSNKSSTKFTCIITVSVIPKNMVYIQRNLTTIISNSKNIMGKNILVYEKVSLNGKKLNR